MFSFIQTAGDWSEIPAGNLRQGQDYINRVVAGLEDMRVDTEYFRFCKATVKQTAKGNVVKFDAVGYYGYPHKIDNSNPRLTGGLGGFAFRSVWLHSDYHECSVWCVSNLKLFPCPGGKTHVVQDACSHHSWC